MAKNQKNNGNGGGRPEIAWNEADWDKFQGLCFVHSSQEEICAVFNISEETLKRLIKKKYSCGFPEIFRRFSATGKASLRKRGFTAAISEDPKKWNYQAWKFLMMNHLGMADKVAQKIEVEERKVVKVDLTWADETFGDRTPDSDAEKNSTTKKV